jgi:pimeloyl-ACP methyl ester carboxylesterase
LTTPQVVLVHAGVAAVREIPEAEAAVVAHAGHLQSLERPEQTAQLVREFLER